MKLRGVRRSSAIPEAVRAVATLAEPDSTDAFEVNMAAPDARSPEQLARSTFEGAPLPIRWLLSVGWRTVVGLRLAPRSSPDHVLGWRILDRSTQGVVLEAQSAFLTAHLVFWVDDARAMQSTFVRYDRRIAAFVWQPVSIIHRRTVPYILRRAVSHP